MLYLIICEQYTVCVVNCLFMLACCVPLHVFMSRCVHVLLCTSIMCACLFICISVFMHNRDLLLFYSGPAAAAEKHRRVPGSVFRAEALHPTCQHHIWDQQVPDWSPVGKGTTASAEPGSWAAGRRWHQSLHLIHRGRLPDCLWTPWRWQRGWWLQKWWVLLPLPKRFFWLCLCVSWQDIFKKLFFFYLVWKLVWSKASGQVIHVRFWSSNFFYGFLSIMAHCTVESYHYFLMNHCTWHM